MSGRAALTPTALALIAPVLAASWLAACQPGAQLTSGVAPGEQLSLGEAAGGGGASRAVVEQLCARGAAAACYAGVFEASCEAKVGALVATCAAGVDGAASGQSRPDAGALVNEIEACVFRATADGLGAARSEVAVCMFQRQKSRKAGA